MPIGNKNLDNLESMVEAGMISRAEADELIRRDKEKKKKKKKQKSLVK